MKTTETEVDSGVEEEPVKKKRRRKSSNAESLSKPEDAATNHGDTVKDELDELLEEGSQKKTGKQKKTKAKKEKAAKKMDSDSEDDKLEALESAYLKKLSQKRETETSKVGEGTTISDDDDSEEDRYWNEDDDKI